MSLGVSERGFAGRRLVPVAIIKIRKQGLFARVGAGSVQPDCKLSLEMLLALEVLLFEPDGGLAGAEFESLRNAEVPASVWALLDRLEANELEDPARRALLLERQALILIDDLLRHRVEDLTSESRATRQVLRALGLRLGVHSLPNASFPDVVTALGRAGFVAPAPGHVDWGDFKRLVPMCPRFGLGRGTPIDRYYLERFIEKIRGDVSGDVVDLGGRRDDQDRHAFANATRYRTLDRKADAGVSIVGDAHDSTLLPEETLDSVVAFNVLEHCAKPWLVVENMGRWLRPGGKAFCMVPAAQRLHRMPEDYWRPLPAALLVLFENFRERKLTVYGNPLTAIASLVGLSIEELSRAELDATHPDYPVAACIVATK